MSSRIEQIIEEIEEYIDSCKFQPLSTSKIIVNKDQMKSSVIRRSLQIKMQSLLMHRQKRTACWRKHRFIRMNW